MFNGWLRTSTPLASCGMFGVEPLKAKPAMSGNTVVSEYTAVLKEDGPWWIGWIEEIPGVNCQEATRDELIETLRLTLKEAIEVNRTAARLAAGDAYSEAKIAL